MHYKCAWRAAYIIGVLLPSTLSNAGLHHPGTWTAESDDKKYLLVMLSPLPLEEDYRYPDEVEAVTWIRSTYPKSRLYLNNGSTEPLWTYDEGYWRHGRPIIAPDGEHVIFPGDWTYDRHSNWRAVEFMQRGTTIREYYVWDVIPQYFLKRVLSGFSLIDCVETSFDGDTLIYSMRTNQGEEFFFDATTGKVVEIRSPFPFLYGTTAASVIALGAVVVTRWRKKQRRARVLYPPARGTYSGARGNCRRNGGSSCGGSG